MRKLDTWSTEGLGSCAVYYCSEWNEYIVRWFASNGQYDVACDYHTDDKDDAYDTAELSMTPVDTQDLY